MYYLFYNNLHKLNINIYLFILHAVTFSLLLNFYKYGILNDYQLRKQSFHNTSDEHPFHRNCSKTRLLVSFACIRKANAIEIRSFVLEVADKVDFRIKMQSYEFLLTSDPSVALNGLKRLILPCPQPN